MAELTRKDLKEVFTESLAPFAKAVQTDFQKVNERLNTIDGRLDKVEFDVHEIKKDVKEMKDSSSELFKKLDDLIGMYKKQEQELAILNMQYKRLEERVAKLEGQKK